MNYDITNINVSNNKCNVTKFFIFINNQKVL